MVDYLIYGITLGSIFLIAGLGVYILAGLCGQSSLTQATYMGIGAFVSAYLSRSSENSEILPGRGMPFPQALIIATLLTALLAVLFGALTIRLKGAQALSGSIAVAVIVMYLLERMNFLSGGSKGASASNTVSFGKTNFADLNIAGHQFSREVGLMILSLVFAFIVFLYVRNVSKSPLGRFMRTVRERNQEAQMCAISPNKTIISAHFLCGLTAGVAGSLYAQVLETFEISSSNPWLGTFALIASMQILVFVVLSQMRNVYVVSLVVFAGSTFFYFVTRALRNTSIFNNSDPFISPNELAALFTAILMILLVRYGVYKHKSSATKQIEV